jgi:hypothetical protein
VEYGRIFLGRNPGLFFLAKQTLRCGRITNPSAMESDAMGPHRFKDIEPLEKHLAEEAERLRSEANLLSPGPQRDQLLRKARQAETGSRITDWLTSPGLRPPN